MNHRVKVWYIGGELPWRADLMRGGKMYRSGASSTPEAALDAAINLGRRGARR